MQDQLDSLNAQIDVARAQLDECQAIAAAAANQPPRPFTLRVTELYCAEAQKEIGADDRLGRITLGTPRRHQRAVCWHRAMAAG